MSTTMVSEEDELLLGDSGQRTTDKLSSNPTITSAHGSIEEHRAMPRLNLEECGFTDKRSRTAETTEQGLSAETRDDEEFQMVETTVMDVTNEPLQHNLEHENDPQTDNVEPNISSKLLEKDVVVHTTDLEASGFQQQQPVSQSSERDCSQKQDPALPNVVQDTSQHNQNDVESANVILLQNLVDKNSKSKSPVMVIISEDSYRFNVQTLVSTLCEIAGATLTGAGLSAIWVLAATPGPHLPVWWTIPSAGLAWLGLRAALLCRISETSVCDLGFGLAGSGLAALAGPFAPSLGYAAPTIAGICLSFAGVILKESSGAGLIGCGLTLVGLTSARLVGELALNCIDRDWGLEMALGLFGLSLTQVVGFGAIGAGVAWVGLSTAGVLERRVTAVGLAGAGLLWAGAALCGEVVRDGEAWMAPLALALTAARASGRKLPLFGVAGGALAGLFLTQKVDESVSDAVACICLMTVGLAMVDVPAAKLAVAGLVGSAVAGYLSVSEGFHISMLTGAGVVSVGLAWKGVEWVGQRMISPGTEKT